MVKKAFMLVLLVLSFSLSLALSIGAEEGAEQQERVEAPVESVEALTIEPFNESFFNTLCICACVTFSGPDEFQVVGTNGSCTDLVGQSCSGGQGTFVACSELGP